MSALLTTVANALGRRDRELEWRGWGLSGIALTHAEYQLYANGQLGPLTFYANVCECGDWSVTGYLALPAPVDRVRRVWLDLDAYARPKVGYQHFPRPRTT